MLFPYSSTVLGETQTGAQIPTEYQQLYSNLKASLDSYDTFLASHKLTSTQSSALSSTATAGTPSMTESNRRIPGFTMFAIAAGIIIGLVALTVL